MSRKNRGVALAPSEGPGAQGLVFSYRALAAYKAATRAANVLWRMGLAAAGPEAGGVGALAVRLAVKVALEAGAGDGVPVASRNGEAKRWPQTGQAMSIPPMLSGNRSG